jgi:hypothetical protein
MSTLPTVPPVATPAKDVKEIPPELTHTTGFSGVTGLDDEVEKKVDEIEMIGEEQAAGFARAAGHSEVTAGMRYLHCSRTIHQLVTDRNRAVGIYLAVASLLWTASSALLNIKPDNVPHLIVPIQVVQRWCLPATFATLTVLALFVALLLVRTRVGLIYEVAKMNALLRLPVGRVQRINPLSIFFILQAFVSLAGGASGALLVLHVLADQGYPPHGPTLAWSAGAGLAITLALLAVYVLTVLHTTADKKLQTLQ